MKFKRIVVTGVGALTPIGNNFNIYWNSLINGVSGASPITLFDAHNFKTRFACQIKNLDLLNFFDKKYLRKIDRCAQLGIISAREAISDSNLLNSKIDKNKVGVIWGSGIGGIITFEDEVKKFVQSNCIPRFNPFFIPKMIADITPGHISIENGFKGPNYTTVSACASSTNAIIDAVMLLRLGKINCAIVGGSEAAISPSGIGGFNALHALSTRNDSYLTASRPFDRDRDGFVMGEGSGTIVLEDYDHAISRSAKIYAELVGIGLSSDAYHITAPHKDGIGAYNVMKNAINDANISIKDIGHINLHGTSTVMGDLIEVNSVKSLFKEHVYNIQLNSTKSMTGHLLGAAGIIEAISVIGVLKYGVIPPTINHFNNDNQIDIKLNFTFNKSVKKEVNYALSNTFGFGGHNACVVFKKYN